MPGAAGGRGVATLRFKNFFPRTADQDVIAGPRDKPTFSLETLDSADEGVVPGAAIQHVVGGVASQHVVQGVSDAEGCTLGQLRSTQVLKPQNGAGRQR